MLINFVNYGGLANRNMTAVFVTPPSKEGNRALIVYSSRPNSDENRSPYLDMIIEGSSCTYSTRRLARYIPWPDTHEKAKKLFSSIQENVKPHSFPFPRSENEWVQLLIHSCFSAPWGALPLAYRGGNLQFEWETDSVSQFFPKVAEPMTFVDENGTIYSPFIETNVFNSNGVKKPSLLFNPAMTTTPVSLDIPKALVSRSWVASLRQLNNVLSGKNRWSSLRTFDSIDDTSTWNQRITARSDKPGHLLYQLDHLLGAPASVLDSVDSFWDYALHIPELEAADWTPQDLLAHCQSEEQAKEVMRNKLHQLKLRKKSGMVISGKLRLKKLKRRLCLWQMKSKNS